MSQKKKKNIKATTKIHCKWTWTTTTTNAPTTVTTTTACTSANQSNKHKQKMGERVIEREREWKKCLNTNFIIMLRIYLYALVYVCWAVFVVVILYDFIVFNYK